MGATTIKRKVRKNIVRAKKRQKKIKRLTLVPVIKNIDIEAVKESFKKRKKSTPKAEAADKAGSETAAQKLENQQKVATDDATHVEKGGKSGQTAEDKVKSEEKNKDAATAKEITAKKDADSGEQKNSGKTSNEKDSEIKVEGKKKTGKNKKTGE